MIDALSLGKNISDEGKGDILFYGYPYDNIYKRDSKLKKNGREYGPDCQRRFFPFIGSMYNIEKSFLNPKYDVDFSSLKIRDLGNYKYPEPKNPKTGKRNRYALSKSVISVDEVLEGDLVETLSEILEFDKPQFQLSSTKEIVYSLMKSPYFEKNMINLEKLPKVGLIYVSQELDLRPLYNDYNLHSGSSLRKFFVDFEPLVSNEKLDVVYFGVNDEQVINHEWDFYKKGSHSISEIHKMKDLRNQQEKSNTEQPCLTKNDIINMFAGDTKSAVDFESQLQNPSSYVAKKFNDVVNKMQGQVDQIFVVFSLEALDSTSVPGSSQTNFNGITLKEASEMFGILGKCEKLKTIMISDYNSCIEDMRSGLGIMNFLYNFCLGFNSKTIPEN